jgi:hypothetical protein
MIASYGTFGEVRRRRRHQAWWCVVRFLSAVLAVLAVGVYAYQVGVSANQARTTQLEADLVRFQHDNLDLRDRIALAAKQSADAEAALESMRQRYASEIPSGEAADLLAELRAQLAAGVEPERLALLIEAAGLADACQSEPVTKRFMPRTPISTEPLSWVRFHDRIIVTGQGEAARNDAGLAEPGLTRHSPSAWNSGRSMEVSPASRESSRSRIGWWSTATSTGSARYVVKIASSR